MAIFTAAAAAVTKAIAAFTWKAFFVAAGKFVLTTLVSVGISKIMTKRALRGANAGADGGGRVQLPPATDNKIPVVYGSAFISGPITDAKITYDNKTMYYVISLAEVCDTTGTSFYSFGNIYYDGKLVGFDGIEPSKVVSLTTNTTPAQVDTKMAGYLYIYLFPNGSSDGVNPLPGSNTPLTAQQILSDPNIPNPVGSDYLMTNCAFAIVKVIYNTDASTTSLGALTVQLQNNIDKPGTCILDYMKNTRYGCAIPESRIDLNSLTALNNYSDELINYTPVGGGSSTQARYRINGPIDTAGSCLENLQILVDACDSWLQYSELSGKWRIVMNKSYQPEQTLNDLFLINSSNLIGGIQVNPIGLNETYNEVEVAYPNANIKDQNDYQVIELSTYQVGVMSPNEAINRLNFNLPVVNNAVQAKYLAARRLLQSREDLVVNFNLDFSGIQIEAGDVIRITFPPYGWTNKLFRVSTVAEEKTADGNLGASVIAFEYNESIYGDLAITDYVPAFNTGLTDPNVFSVPLAPTLTLNPDASGNVTSFKVTGTVPAVGTTIYMDFNYGTASSNTTHRLYRQVQNGLGLPFTANASVNVDVNDLPAGNYYWSITARNNTAGRQGPSSNVFAWQGAVITNYDANTGVGGITGSQIQANTISGTNIELNTITGNLITPATITGNLVQLGTLTGNLVAQNTLTGNLIALNTITGNLVANNTLTGNLIANNTITGNLIVNNTLTANKLSVNDLSAITANMGTLTSGNILTDAAPNYRTEISSTGSFPIWFGNGTKTAANGLFYVQTDGNVYIKAIINAQPGSTIPAGVSMTANVAPISGSNSGFAPTGNVTSSAAVVTINNGTAPYTYLWTKQLDAFGTTTVSSSTSSGPTFTGTDIPDGTPYTSIWNVQVTDTNSNVANATAYVRLLWTDIT